MREKDRRALAAVCLAGLGVLVGCSASTYQERALVGRVDAGCEGPATPVASATVRITCPGEATPRLVATADARGHFEAPLASMQIPMNCELLVEGPGVRPRSYRVEDVCIDKFGASPVASCERVSVAARLAPAGGKP